MLLPAKRVRVLSDILRAEFPKKYQGMLAKSVLVFYRNLVFAIIKQIVSGSAIEVTIPTGQLDSGELERLEQALTCAGWYIKERDRDYYLVVPKKQEPETTDRQIMEGHMCPYCRVATVYQEGRYECPQCHASVECHPGTLVSMGFVANGQLRKQRARVHDVLDALWMQGSLSRKEVYRRLREKMGLTKAQCHVAKFDEGQCRQALQCIKQITEEIKNVIS